MSKFKEEFESYREAVNNDIEQVELVISWLEQYKANFEYAEIEKIINFFKGYRSRMIIEKTKTQELSWHIED